MSCTVIATARSGRYRIITDYVTDPARDTLLMRVRFQPLTRGQYQLYARLDPTVNGNGGGGSDNAGADSAVTDTSTGHDVLVSSTRTPPPTPPTATTRRRCTWLSRPLLAGHHRLRGSVERRPDPARSGSQADHRPTTPRSTATSCRSRRSEPGSPIGPRAELVHPRIWIRRHPGRGRPERPGVAATSPSARRCRPTTAGGGTTTRPCAGHRPAVRPQPLDRAGARPRVLHQRQCRQGLRGQDVPRRDRQPASPLPGARRYRPAIRTTRTSGPIARSSPATSMRPGRVSMARRHGHRARRDAVPVRPPAAA